MKINRFNFNLSYPIKCQTVWTPIRSEKNVRPDLDPNCLKGLSADDNVMSRFNTKENTLVQLQHVITLKVSIVWTPNRCEQNVVPDLGQNYLKGLSADDNVILRFTQS